MKPVFFAKLSLLALTFGLSSCGTMKVVKNTATATKNSVAKLGDIKMPSLPKFGREPDIYVVEAREKDLKKVKSGHEQALAYHSTASKRSFWLFKGPVDFKEPNLPTAGGEMDGSLLPPKAD
ncbi:MAG: hypothetical protein QM680_02445 [Luteolibacter sp.]